jgi:prolyl-tRNA editing enzyme YbaK/EbsC (Cys-tRNA(Pro) deacylase)
VSESIPTGPVLRAIRLLLDEHGVEYRAFHHEPTRTAQEAARVRGLPVEIGGKSIVARVDRTFRLFVLSGARRLYSRAICKRLGAERFRFATAEELLDLTGLVPGSVPPFGRPILPFDLYLDEAILDNDRIAFNAGTLTDSIVLDRARYVEIACPVDTFSLSR